MLTKKQRHRLAREARKLAEECLTNGPEMRNDWCGCAIGLSLERAKLLPTTWGEQGRLGHQLENLLEPGLLSSATCERAYRNNPTAVVFPLLAWADALEAP